MPLNLEAAKAIQNWLEVLGTHRPDAPLFESQRKGKAIDRTQAYRILEEAYDAAGLTGKLGHPRCGRRLLMASMRPSAMIW